jgi:pimeloyl-ACP methyl ester carboxylesterase
LADSRIEFRFVQVNDVTLHCAIAGPLDGPFVILLHGFPEFWFGWRDYILPLAERGFRVVAPDQRGYNLSSKPESADAYRLDLAAADIFALASAFGRDRFHVVGHDWGAAVVWTMAGLDPKRLTSATMIQAPHPAVWLRAIREDPEQRQKSRYVQILRLPWLSEMGLKLGNFAGLARGFRSSSRPEAFGPEILDRYREAWSQPGALTGMLNWYRALFVDEPATPQPKSLKPPALVLWGDRDDFGVPKLADDSSALCANVRVRHLPQASHWIIHDAPDVVRDALLDHL